MHTPSWVKVLSVFCLVLLAACQPADAPTTETPEVETEAARKHVRFVYFIEKGEQYEQREYDAVYKAAFDLQRYWYEQFGGTFYLSDQVVDVIYADHTANWYMTTPDGIHGSTSRWYRLGNVKKEVFRKLGVRDFDPNVRVVSFPTSRSDGKVGANFGGAWLDGDDLWALYGWSGGLSYPYDDNGPSNPLAHLAHEFGHVFGLQHTGPFEDIMRQGFYTRTPGYAGLTYFSEENRTTVKQNPNNRGFLDAKPGERVTPTPAPSTQLIPNGTYSMKAKHSGKCVDVVGANTGNGVNIWQWTCTGDENQRWTFAHLGNNTYKITSVRSGKVLDVYGSGQGNAANVIQWDYLGGNNQKWKATLRNNTLQFQASHSNKCLNVSGADSRANVVQQPCNSSADAQHFTLVKR